MKKLVSIFKNKWVKFSLVSLLYVLWFVVWGRSFWPIFGLVLIYDYYISELYRKLFWDKYLQIKENNKTVNFFGGWIEAIVFAVIVASLFRGYVLELYVIPTSSMEKTLLVGDYLWVSKVSYGPKRANTPLSLPFVHNYLPWDRSKTSYSDAIERPYKRLAGLRDVKRGDIVVFNYPQGDTVMVSSPEDNYYRYARRYGENHIKEQTDLIVHPVDKRDNYIKRAVAIHGDELEIREGIVYVNGEVETDIEDRQYTYKIITTESIPFKALEDMNLKNGEDIYIGEDQTILAYLTDKSAQKMRNLKGVTSVERIVYSDPDVDIFPYNLKNYKWSVDNFGPLAIPAKGTSVELTLENLPIYERIISLYESNDLQVVDGKIYINSQPANSYTFKMDYFFMMGDNRHNSLDSRYWGFVPEDHIVGTPWLIVLSLDKDKSFPSNIRFNRIGTVD